MTFQIRQRQRVIRHLASPLSDWSRCGLFRNRGVPAWKDGDQLCVICAAEYERVYGKPWTP